MHNLDLILTLAIGFTAAATFGYLTHRLGLSPIVGYLLAGIVFGAIAILSAFDRANPKRWANALF